jgi:hypothetical protein
MIEVCIANILEMISHISAYVLEQAPASLPLAGFLSKPTKKIIVIMRGETSEVGEADVGDDGVSVRK